VTERQTPVKQAQAYVQEKGGIFDGITVCFSGFQGEQLTKLRDKAVTLGADVAKDLNDRVTHVVSQFSATPKVKQVYNSADPSGKCIGERYDEETGEANFYSQRWVHRRCI
jgi:hypothetical protein